MADPYTASPSFINPSYATPEQRKAMRAYAQELMSGKGQQPVKYWTQGLSNIVSALVGGGLANTATQQEQLAKTQYARQLMESLRGGDLSKRVGTLASPEAPDISTLVGMKPFMEWGPSTSVSVTPEGAVSKTAPTGPLPAGPVPHPAPVTQGALPPAQENMNLTGPGKEITGIDYGPTTFSNRFGAAAPGVDPEIAKMVPTMKYVSGVGASLGANRQQMGEDIKTAYGSIPIIQTLNTMKDDIARHGEKMVWGPTSEWITNLKRGIAQHAPGLLSEKDLAGLASADSFDKLSAQLTTMVGRQGGGTDLSLLQGMRSVPSAHNSREGAMALIDMLKQTVALNGQFVAENQYKMGQPGYDHLAAKNKFFEDHPIVNPLTGNPIRLDLTGKKNKPAGSDGWGMYRRGGT